MKSSKCKRTIKYHYERLSKRVKTNCLERKKKKNSQSKNQNSDSNFNHRRLLKDTELDHFEPEIIKIFEEYYLLNGFHTPIQDDDEIEIIEEDAQVSTTTEDTSFVMSKTDALRSTDPMVGIDNHAPDQINFISTSG
ncbi:Hypothetical protein CINCED_3A021818 [Cinara cedri]|uniref:Uncharacterized protein n=1 Tax=Cinara cedri TaxID=506608 RepID=A0A5E4N9P8_9HEMI|nr:Hypothetical protein CINCED_3A021818 [Cinara cedri]